MARRSARARLASRSFAALVVVVGAVVLTGWALGIDVLTHTSSGVATAVPNTALALVLGGAALLLVTPAASRRRRFLAGTFASLVFVIGLVAITEHVVDAGRALDALLVSAALPRSLRPALFTGVVLVALGAALIAHQVGGQRLWRLSQLLAIASLLLLAPTLLGFVYDGVVRSPVPPDLPTTPVAAAALAMLGAALFAARPDVGPMALIMSDGTAGATLRRLGPPIALAPPLIGTFRLLGERAQLYDNVFGAALGVVLGAAALVALLFWHAVALDRTDRARAESEARLRAIVDNAVDAIITIDDRGVIQSWNPEATRLFGFAAGEAVGKGVEMIMPEPPRSQHGRHIERYLRTGERKMIGRTREVTGLHKDGSPVPLEVRITETFLDGRRIFTGTLRDITAQRRAQAEREMLLESERAARVEAQQAASARDEFVAAVSHELRTPLTAVMGWVGLIERGGLDAEATRRAATLILRNAKSLAQIIDDLLDESRIVSGKLRMEVAEVDLRAVCEQAAAVAQVAAEAKGVLVHAALGPKPCLVRGDAGRLGQVVSNLLSNAVKFTPAGGRVDLELRCAGRQAEIVVRDTGAGIDPRFLPHVFERFRQADAGVAREHGGLGLGLAIARQLVELHGGTVRAESEGEGRGASFTVTLALAEARGCVEPPPAEVESISLAGVKVMVVDDEADARAMVERVLAEQGAEVLAAGSAGEALAALPRARPDVLLSDIGMPQQDGYQLLCAVRALGRDQGGDTPAAAVTAYTRPEDRRRAAQAGFQAHVCKPVDRLQLLGVVARLSGKAA